METVSHFLEKLLGNKVSCNEGFDPEIAHDHM